MSQAETTLAVASYRRPAGPNSFVDRAARDFDLLGQVEKVLSRPPKILAAMVRCEPDRYLRFMDFLAALVDRQVAIVDAATEAHEAIEAAFKD